MVNNIFFIWDYMKREFERSIREAKELISRINDSAHSFAHAESVVKFTLEIADGYPEVDRELIEVAAWWHDIGRLYAEEHEKLSAEMAQKSLEKLGVEKEICRKVYDAIVFHKWSMHPKTLEGEIIRDADKLDFISIERWKKCLASQNLSVLEEISNLLPRLRNELLHLEISKKIYDRMIQEFKGFVVGNEDLDFLRIKNGLSSDY